MTQPTAAQSPPSATPTLPIEAVFAEIVASLAVQRRLVLQAPPGAGKSTYLPLQLVKQQCFSGRIIMLEPRRLAARSIAYYLASQLNEPVGQTIGYRVRQESKVSKHTRLEIVTEGILTRMIQQDPELTGVDLVIFDEFHERSLHGDLALTLSLDIQQGLREDLTLLIMSATLDSDGLGLRLDCPVITSAGRSYPVAINYIPTKVDQQLATISELILRLVQQQPHSMLVFLPGAKEINQLAERLNSALMTLKSPDSDAINVYPLYGDLDKKDQQAAIATCIGNERKIVLATNIAETSLTIDGIGIVIDSGLKRQAKFNPKNGVTKLQTVTIAKSSAIQRAGRAGRLMAGTCYRLDSAEQFARRQEFDQPEILTNDLMPLVLEVAHWGAQIHQLPWIDPPPAALVAQAEDLLKQLEIFDPQGQITPLGQQVGDLGCHPRIAHMLLKAKQLKDQVQRPVDTLACYLAAIIEAGDILPKAMRFDNSNIEARIRWLLAGKAPQVMQQAKVWIKRLAADSQAGQNLPLEYSGVLAALAFPDRIAKSRGLGYQLSNGYGVNLNENDPLCQESLLVVIDLIEIPQKTLVGLAASVTLSQIEDYLPHLLTKQDFVGWGRTGDKGDKGDKGDEKLISEQQTRLGQIILARQMNSNAITASQRTTAFIQLIKAKGLATVLNIDDDISQLLLRLTAAHQLWPNQWQSVSDEALTDSLDQWLGPYLTDVKTLAQLKRLNLKQPLLSLFDWAAQQQLAEFFPVHYQVPTGTQVTLTYRPEQSPKLSVRIQELFGQTRHPTIAQGQIPLVIELLSPARRPIQVTQDLAGFWQGSYQQVKKEMKGRYPKHYWPDDPAIAMPTTVVKKKMGLQ